MHGEHRRYGDRRHARARTGANTHGTETPTQPLLARSKASLDHSSPTAGGCVWQLACAVLEKMLAGLIAWGRNLLRFGVEHLQPLDIMISACILLLSMPSSFHGLSSFPSFVPFVLAVPRSIARLLPFFHASPFASSTSRPE
eukprot:6189166-Pleurochrysis_carterae.AAC.1